MKDYTIDLGNTVNNLDEDWPDHVSSMRQIIQTNTATDAPVLFHFHGGLVEAKEAHRAAGKISKRVLKRGIVPIIFVWKTGIPENFEVLSLNQWLGAAMAVAKFLEKYVLRGISKVRNLNALSDDEIDIRSYGTSELEEWLATKSQGELHKLEKEAAKLPTNQKMDANHKALVAGIPLWLIALGTDVLLRAAVRFAEPANRDWRRVYPVLLECVVEISGILELVKTQWDVIKTKATKFVNAELVNFILEVAKTRKVFLVGHSAGSIPICHLLALPELSGAISGVALTAPAATVELFLRSAKINPNVRIKIFTMSEEAEFKERFLNLLKGKFPWIVNVSGILPESFLYFISGFCERDSDKHLLGLVSHLKQHQAQIHGFSVGNSPSKLIVTTGPTSTLKASDHNQLSEDKAVWAALLSHLLDQ